MPSTTLTWAGSGNGTKTGTTAVELFNDLDTLITSKAADATFFWQTAGKNVGASPQYLLLSPKSGGNRRIALICWSSAPAANNTAILDGTPGVGLYAAYWPNGSANTLSNLTAASGTICGNDTGIIKATYCGSLASLYAASVVPYYMDSAEAMIFGLGNPGGASDPMFGVGTTLVDGSDVAYDGVWSTGGGNGTFGSSSSPIGWTATTITAGPSTVACVRTNYGAANRAYFAAWVPTGVWGGQAVGSADILTDTANTKAWFVPIQLLGQVKGEGFSLKLRQFGIGPATVGPFSVYNSTGPVVQARNVLNATAGSSAGFPWVTNFKI